MERGCPPRNSPKAGVTTNGIDKQTTKTPTPYQPWIFFMVFPPFAQFAG
jgi:hypothetical protein